VIIDYAGVTTPTGWLLCDGTSYTTTTYPALFAAIQYTFGGSGANFNVPDLRGRVSVGAGQGTGLTLRTLGQGTGAAWGEEKHLLLATELASHTHTASSTQGTHSHSDNGHVHGGSVSFALAGAGGSAVTVVGGAVNTGVGFCQLTLNSAGAITTTVAATAAGVSHNIMQPFAVLNRIIKL
jgi:microcystin-dependent protein